MGVAILLDPRFKTEMLYVCFEMLLGVTDEEIEYHVHKVFNLCCDLMAEYQIENAIPSTHAPTISSNSVMEAKEVMSIFTARVAQKRPTALRFKNELERYMDDEYVPAKQEDFDLLGWWKVAGTCYPILMAIARDVFAITVSTVASESAFSTSGRVLSEHRSQLTPDLLEALMCTQDWQRNQAKDDDKAQMASLWTCLQDIQEGLQEITL